jgi:peptidoglycan hydrolase-like protein with peptidoglycan-binding domain
MKIKIALAIFLGTIAIARADDTVAQAQQALKDQGFYYGEVTGEKSADTTAALRRFQIRNGLEVTGELDSETMRTLVSGNPSPAPTAPAATAPSATPYVAASPQAKSGDEEENSANPFRTPPQDRSVDGQIRGDEPVYPSGPAMVPPAGGLFAGTPYEMAPPLVQRDVIASAQGILGQRGFYRGEIDGAFGPNTEFSLRAYQARIGLPVTGRLDLETLAALNLLPGPNRQLFGPRRHVPPPFGPPVRGEWVH